MTGSVDQRAHNQMTGSVDQRAHKQMTGSVDQRAHKQMTGSVDQRAHKQMTGSVDQRAHKQMTGFVDQRAHKQMTGSVDQRAHNTMTGSVDQRAHKQMTGFVDQRAHKQMTGFVDQRAHKQMTGSVDQRAHKQMTGSVDQRAHKQMTGSVDQRAHKQMTGSVDQRAHKQMTGSVDQRAHKQMTGSVDQRAHKQMTGSCGASVEGRMRSSARSSCAVVSLHAPTQELFFSASRIINNVDRISGFVAADTEKSKRGEKEFRLALIPLLKFAAGGLVSMAVNSQPAEGMCGWWGRSDGGAGRCQENERTGNIELPRPFCASTLRSPKSLRDGSCKLSGFLLFVSAWIVVDHFVVRQLFCSWGRGVDYSPPAWANRIRFPAWSRSDFRRTMRRRVFSGISRFPRLSIPALLHTHLTSPSSACKTPFRASQICSLSSFTHFCSYLSHTWEQHDIVSVHTAGLSCNFRVDLPWRSRLVREAVGSDPGASLIQINLGAENKLQRRPSLRNIGRQFPLLGFADCAMKQYHMSVFVSTVVALREEGRVQSYSPTTPLQRVADKSSASPNPLEGSRACIQQVPGLGGGWPPSSVAALRGRKINNSPGAAVMWWPGRPPPGFSRWTMSLALGFSQGIPVSPTKPLPSYATVDGFAAGRIRWRDS
ncbi:hypothetical protein PR048_022385 [Dryococelus australis]|uniref:Uncharacterized protein n=1 Tax=Dryococelus australis TaxID=614101 RepID=A0ABQ9H139_9NEOP|nr:hypothetical protein PR048_022385 [Dryococelus australis]